MKNPITSNLATRKTIALIKWTALLGAVALTVSACSSIEKANTGYHTERTSSNPHDSTYKTVPDKTAQ